ncbi:MAG: MarR family transcriptional regulator [Sphingomonas sp.]|nr:MarR family transcriptional regulator [Sphingomonas sp.]
MDSAVTSFRAFNRVHTRFAGVLTPRYMGSELSLAEARMLYEIAVRDSVLASELQALLDLDAGYASRILRRFEERGWIARGRGSDARRRPITLTEAGRVAFESLDAATRADAERALGALGEGGSRALAQALDTARTLMEGAALPWTLRPFRAGDMGMIAARQAILYNEGYDWGRGMEVLLGEVVTAFLRDFRPGREQCWVAERGGRMLGSVFLVDAGDGIAKLRLLYVEPDARGTGIGQALVATCVEFARAAGYRKLTLWTHAVLTSARRIYAAAGMRLVSSEVHEAFGKPELGETWEMDLQGESTFGGESRPAPTGSTAGLQNRS